MIESRSKPAEIIYLAMKEAGINFVACLPDRLTAPIQELMANDPEVTTILCSREDEGVAIAMGAYLGGKKPAVIMEGSGIGWCALIFARGIAQRTPLLIIASHNSTLGEIHDYHTATRMVAEPVLQALRIPYVVLMNINDARTIIREAQMTVQGQAISVAVLIPRHIMIEEDWK